MIHNFTIKNNKLFIGGISAEDLVAEYGSPLYVYDADIIRRQYRALVNYITYPKLKIHYACKANTNVALLKILREEGSNIECVSKGEILAALEAGFTSVEIIYTCSYITKEELQFVIDKNIMINLDSLTQVKRYGELNPGGKISLRLNQGIGAAHHEHNITGGPDSKFGIDISEIDEAKKIAQNYDLKIIGIHQHIGSGILENIMFMKAINKLLETAKQFKDLEFLDFGGGFGIPYNPGDVSLDMSTLGKLITETVEKFVKEYGREIEIKFEPGRFLVGEAGVLLGTVTEIKKSPSHTFVGIDAGFNQLIRPMMYGSYHEIVNASNVKGKEEAVWVVGNICESGDIFGRDRKLTQANEGDIFAILGAGAYGYAMSFPYNARPQPVEILVEGTQSRVIREQKNFNIDAETKKKLR
jgi:diaminopimelate decarboxylase